MAAGLVNMKIFNRGGREYGVWTVVARTAIKNQIHNVLPLFHSGHLIRKKSLCFFSV